MKAEQRIHELCRLLVNVLGDGTQHDGKGISIQVETRAGYDGAYSMYLDGLESAEIRHSESGYFFSRPKPQRYLNELRRHPLPKFATAPDFKPVFNGWEQVVATEFVQQKRNISVRLQCYRSPQDRRNVFIPLYSITTEVEDRWGGSLKDPIKRRVIVAEAAEKILGTLHYVVRDSWSVRDLYPDIGNEG